MIAGRYALEREIGRGASGVVWLGRDERLGRPVALKRIGWAANDADPAAAAERARREAQLAARLNHPHLVAVYDTVVDADSDVRWLVMEYVDGTDLARLVRQHALLTPHQAAPLLAQAAEALAVAHAAGIVHRDVKPSNILVDRSGQVKLTDFGIARLGDDVSLTRTGMVTGSPAYLAPEVASGRRGDERSDVWALGATAFHVLAGHPAYDVGDNVLGTLYRIVHEEPPRLPDAGPLAAFLEHTMAKDPADRWTMAQAHAVLTAVPPARLDDAGTVAPVSAGDDHPRTPTAVPVVGDGTDTGADLGSGYTSVLPEVPVAPAGPVRAVDAAVPFVVPPAEPPARRAPTAQPAPGRGGRRPGRWLLGLAVLVAFAVVLIAGIVLLRPGSGGGAADTPATSASTTKAPAGPTKAGMTAFIDRYVAAVSDDPATSWTMLTPKFQKESGGFARYRSYWESATDGRVLDISANPKTLQVSYHVYFADHDNGPGPTVLELTYDKGTYKINGESTKGFVPAD